MDKDVARRTGVATRATRQVYYAYGAVDKLNCPPAVMETIRKEVEMWLRAAHPELDNAEIYYCMLNRMYYSATLQGLPWALVAERGPEHLGDPRDLPKQLDILDNLVINYVFWA